MADLKCSFIANHFGMMPKFRQNVLLLTNFAGEMAKHIDLMTFVTGARFKGLNMVRSMQGVLIRGLLSNKINEFWKASVCRGCLDGVYVPKTAKSELRQMISFRGKRLICKIKRT
ncbi:hypothetical protein PPYR_03908 [Photinus pyralis]|uniref:Uncharacterized protein n=1 Tax=Photinus pyralis TaxID=7054 RepID=A0A5N4AWI2_PHOPY|nr:hypothetical protein PPYR_03908 [Photinus pyralis]